MTDLPVHENAPDGSFDRCVYRIHAWMTLAVIVVMIVEWVLPIRWGGAFNTRSHDLDELVEIYRAVFIPWMLILPWCLFLAVGAELWARILAWVCYFKAALVGLVIIYIKLTMFPSGAGDTSPLFEYFLHELCVVIVLLSIFILYPLGGCLSLPAVPILLLGLLTARTLSAKCYRFGMRDRAMLFMRLGWKRFRRLPRREELEVVPGYNSGSVDNIVWLMKNP